MSAIPTIVVTPSSAADAYAKAGSTSSVGAASGTEFGGLLQRALNGAIETGHAAESQAMQAVRGEGSLSQVVTALSRAELTLQTATVIRDRVVQAYQDVMKMPI